MGVPCSTVCRAVLVGVAISVDFTSVKIEEKNTEHSTASDCRNQGIGLIDPRGLGRDIDDTRRDIDDPNITTNSRPSPSSFTTTHRQSGRRIGMSNAAERIAILALSKMQNILFVMKLLILVFFFVYFLQKALFQASIQASK